MYCFFIVVFIEEVKCSADQITGLHLNLLNKVLNSLFTMLVFLSRFRGGFSSAISLTSHGSGSAFSTKASSRLLIIHSVNFSSSAGLNFLCFKSPSFRGIKSYPKRLPIDFLRVERLALLPTK